ncbi:CAAX prenyl protease-like protein [Kineococcus xinjiangensis]|uniref:CAAX prenyl protease-like protein n=1 Tax=Kineococcus xinjiangensis TaxID=512762 RepID=A0A2S6IVF9_9ACTN|nr:CPBP family glutamic-type intramembrane protease [Kineococcus xinjiangensis]PPK98347.1 CAAX prenyl protease-like protein [Kineococcus xinjiangensis]
MQTPRAQRATGLGRALLGGGVLALGSGCAAALTAAAGGADAGFWRRLPPAALCTVLVVAALLALRRRRARAGAVRGGAGLGSGLGLDGGVRLLRAVALGGAVVLAAGAAVLVPAAAGGLLRWEGAALPADPPAAARLLVAEAVLVLLLRVLPAEVALRGYALTALRESGAGRGWAAVLATTVFVLAPSASSAVERAVLGFPPVPVGAVPGGWEPLTQALLLALLGLVLAAARYATREESLGTCIGAHLALLLLLRVVAGAGGGTGAVAASPSALPLVAATLVAAGLVFVLLHRRAVRGPARVAGPVAVLPDAA